MQPVSFSSQEVVYAKHQPQYLQLPCEKWKDGTVVTKWSLTWKERFKIFFNGHFFFSILTFNHPLQPMRPSVDRPKETTKYDR